MAQLAERRSLRASRAGRVARMGCLRVSDPPRRRSTGYRRDRIDRDTAEGRDVALQAARHRHIQLRTGQLHAARTDQFVTAAQRVGRALAADLGRNVLNVATARPVAVVLPKTTPNIIAGDTRSVVGRFEEECTGSRAFRAVPEL